MFKKMLAIGFLLATVGGSSANAQDTGDTHQQRGWDSAALDLIDEAFRILEQDRRSETPALDLIDEAFRILEQSNPRADEDAVLASLDEALQVLETQQDSARHSAALRLIHEAFIALGCNWQGFDCD
ncbi:MAG: hypothetical protein AAGA48_19495 [Myxococcota bacterium]